MTPGVLGTRHDWRHLTPCLHVLGITQRRTLSQHIINSQVWSSLTPDYGTSIINWINGQR